MHKILLLLFVNCLMLICTASEPDSLQQNIVKSTLGDNNFTPPVNRSILSFKGKSIWFKLNPVTYLGTGLLFVYQRIFSEQIQAACNYEVSCSEYTKKAVEKKGLIKGALLGVDQLSSCFPKVVYEYPDHMISKDYKVKNAYSLDD